MLARRVMAAVSVVDVTDGADVYVRLAPLEFRLAHVVPLLKRFDFRILR
jgi:hypothetical protein